MVDIDIRWPENGPKPMATKTKGQKPTSKPTGKGGRPSQRLRTRVVDLDREAHQICLDAISQRMNFVVGRPTKLDVDDLTDMMRREEPESQHPTVIDGDKLQPPVEVEIAQRLAPEPVGVASDVLQLLAVIHSVLFDADGIFYPLPMELRLLEEIGVAVRNYQRALEQQQEIALRNAWMKRTAEMYDRVASCWEKGSDEFRSGSSLIGKNLSENQRAVLDECRQTFRKLFIDVIGQSEEEASQSVSKLVVDGIYIRKNGGAVKAAAKRLAEVLNLPEATLRRDRDMTTLEIRRIGHNALQQFTLIEPEDATEVTKRATSVVANLVTLIAQNIERLRSKTPNTERERPTE